MSRQKKIWDMEVSIETFKLLQPLVDVIKYNQQVDPQVALQQVFLSDPNFTLNQLVLTEVIQVLSKICKVNQDIIIHEVQKYVQDTQTSEKYMQVQKWIRQIKPIAQNKNQPPLFSPLKKFVNKHPFLGTHPLGIAFQSKLSKFREDSHQAYSNSVNEFKHCYTQFLQPSIYLADTMPEFITCSLPQIHPSLGLIFAPPLQKLLKISVPLSKYKYSNSQIDITFSNDNFDAPDLIFDSRKIYKELQPQFSGCQLYDQKQYQIFTKKPVAQHHGIIDCTGCYIPKDIAYHGLYQKLLSQLSANQLITPFEIFSQVQHFLYFPPFQTIIDQRFYGTISRFIRFSSTVKESNCYIKSIGIGGQIRFQIHAQKDLGAGEEITLFKNYSIIKEGSLLDQFLDQYNDIQAEMDTIYTNNQWKKHIKTKLTPENEKIALSAFFISFYDILISKTNFNQQLTTPEQLTNFLKENLKFSFTPIESHQFTPSQPEQSINSTLVNPQNRLGIYQNYDTPITIGNEFLPVIFKNLLEFNLLQSSQNLIRFVSLFNSPDTFKNSFNYFAIQRAYSFYSYQCELEPQNFQARQVKQILETQTKRLLDSQLVLFSAPHFFPNFLPFQQYSPLLRNVFDSNVEKVLITSFNALSTVLVTAATGLDEFSPFEIKKICLRLIQQNSCFNRLAWGENVTLEEFQHVSYALMSKATYKDIDEILAQFIDVNVIELAKYANYAFRNEIRDINDKIELIINAFRGRIEPPLEAVLRCRVDQELVNFICQELMEFVKNLAPLAVKPKVDGKKSAGQEGLGWPYCSLVGSVGIDSGWMIKDKLVSVGGKGCGCEVSKKDGYKCLEFGYGMLCAIQQVQGLSKKE